MERNLKALFNYTISLVVLYGSYVNTGGFFSVTVFYLWIISAMLVIISIALSNEIKSEEIRYGLAKDYSKNPRHDCWNNGNQVSDLPSYIALEAVFLKNYIKA